MVLDVNDDQQWACTFIRVLARLGGYCLPPP